MSASTANSPCWSIANILSGGGRETIVTKMSQHMSTHCHQESYHTLYCYAFDRLNFSHPLKCHVRFLTKVYAHLDLYSNAILMALLYAYVKLLQYAFLLSQQNYVSLDVLCLRNDLAQYV